MTDDKPTTDQPTDATITPEATATHEPAAAHAPADHVLEIEGVGGHVDEHMSGDHGHAEPRVGPVDWAGWGYAVVGVIAGLVVVGAFWLALS